MSRSDKATEPPRPVPDVISQLLLRIIEGWSPAMAEVEAVQAVRVGGIDCDDMAPELRVIEDRLVLTLKGVHGNLLRCPVLTLKSR